MSHSRNLTEHHGAVHRADREQLLRQRGCVVWLTGLSGSGKSTVAHALAKQLHDEQHLAYVLDGDNIRNGLNSDLAFSASDRQENIRRIGEVAALFADAGVIAVVAFISPFRADRERARHMAGDEVFIEVFVDTPLEVCEARDSKGLYRRARTGQIAEFTGVSSPYERPESADVVLAGSLEVEEATRKIWNELTRRRFLEPRRSA